MAQRKMVAGAGADTNAQWIKYTIDGDAEGMVYTVAPIGFVCMAFYEGFVNNDGNDSNSPKHHSTG